MGKSQSSNSKPNCAAHVMICYGVDGGIRGGGGAHKDPQLHWEEPYVIESEEQTIDKAVMLGSGFPCVDF